VAGELAGGCAAAPTVGDDTAGTTVADPAVGVGWDVFDVPPAPHPASASTLSMVTITINTCRESRIIEFLSSPRQ